MRLTTFTDYALRMLMMAEESHQQLVTIEQVSKRHSVSRAHLMKVANQLTRTGFLTAVRGRNGGLLLARSADSIRISDVVRATEPDFALVECFESGNTCAIIGACRLPAALHKATAAFLSTLDDYTLADITTIRRPPATDHPPSSDVTNKG